MADASDYGDIYNSAGQAFGVDPALLQAIVTNESHGDPNALSPQGAQGAAQIMPATAAGLNVTNPNDPRQSIYGAAKLVAQLSKQYGGSVPDVVAAYHGGTNQAAWGPKTKAYQQAVLATYKGLAGNLPAASDDDQAAAYQELTGAPSPNAQGPTAKLSDAQAYSELTGGAAPKGSGSVSVVTDPNDADVPPPPVATAAGAQPVKPNFLLGLEAGVTKPWDNAAIWAEAGLNKLGVPMTAIDHGLGAPTAQEAADQHQNYLMQQAQQGVTPGGIGRVIGESAATLPLMVENPLVYGAMSGALTTNHPNDAGSVAKDAVIGGLFGKVADTGLGAVKNIVSPALSPAVTKLLGEGVSLTPGQIIGGTAKRLEDAATSIPILGDFVRGAQARGMDSFNRAAVDQTLAPIGGKLPANIASGHDAVDYAHQALSNVYDSALSKASVAADPQFATDMVQRVQPIAAGLPQAQAEQLKNIVQARVMDAFDSQNGMSGDALKKVDAYLGKQVRQYGKSADPAQRDLAEALGEVQGSLRDMVSRQNPAVAPQIAAANQGYANLVRVEGAAGSSGANSGAFTPAQLKNAVRASDSSVRKSGFARGNALMQDYAEAGNEVLPNKVPDSGTPLRGTLNLLTGAGLAGGAAALHVNPLAAVGAGAAVLPYTRLGQKIVTPLLTSRPAGAAAVRNMLTSLKKPLVAAGSNALINAAGSGP